jgi:16S rRNA (guanine527-N7)-methyltransferase
VHSRLEAYRPGPKFATITARAVASLSELCDSCAHLAAADARLLALKGRLPDQEIAALTETVSLSVSATGEPLRTSSVVHAETSCTVHALRVPQLDGERNLIDIPFHASAHG